MEVRTSGKVGDAKATTYAKASGDSRATSYSSETRAVPTERYSTFVSEVERSEPVVHRSKNSAYLQSYPPQVQTVSQAPRIIDESVVYGEPVLIQAPVLQQTQVVRAAPVVQTEVVQVEEVST